MGHDAHVKRLRKVVSKEQKKEVKRWLGETLPVVEVAERTKLAEGVRKGRVQTAVVGLVLTVVAFCVFVLMQGCGEGQATPDSGVDAGADAQPQPAPLLQCGDGVQVFGGCDGALNGVACLRCSVDLCAAGASAVCVLECKQCSPPPPKGCHEFVNVVGLCNERDKAGRQCAKCSALASGVACLVNENTRCAFECQECAL